MAIDFLKLASYDIGFGLATERPTRGEPLGGRLYFYVATDTGDFSCWDGIVWKVLGAAGLGPVGPAGGDLGGSYPNPTVLSVAHVTTGVLAVANGGTGSALGAAAGGAVNTVQYNNAGVLGGISSVTTDGLNLTITGAALSLTSSKLIFIGNISSTAWTTNGLRIQGVSGILTDTTSSGTVAAAYTDVLGGNTIAASAATTFTNYITAYFRDPVAGTNVTLTNKFALGADSLKVGTSNALTVSNTGVLTATSPVFTTPAIGAATGTSLVLSGDDKAATFTNSTGTFLMISTAAFANGAASATGTLTNAPAAGNPTKWIPVNDNGTTRFIPAW